MGLDSTKENWGKCQEGKQTKLYVLQLLGLEPLSKSKTLVYIRYLCRYGIVPKRTKTNVRSENEQNSRICNS